MITNVLIGLYTQDKVISGDRPDVLGDRRICEGLSPVLDIWETNKVPPVSLRPETDL